MARYYLVVILILSGCSGDGGIARLPMVEAGRSVVTAPVNSGRVVVPRGAVAFDSVDLSASAVGSSVGSVELSEMPLDRAVEVVFRDILHRDVVVAPGSYPAVTVSIARELSQSELVDLLSALALERGASLQADASGRWRLALGVPQGEAVERVVVIHRRPNEFRDFGRLFVASGSTGGDVASATVDGARDSASAAVGGSSRSRPPLVSVVVDERSRSVLLSGPGAAVREVAQLIRAADQPVLSGQVTQFFAASPDAVDLLALLVAPSVMVARWGGGVIASGSPGDVARVGELLALLARTGQSVVQRVELHRLTSDECLSVVSAMGRSGSSGGVAAGSMSAGDMVSARGSGGGGVSSGGGLSGSVGSASSGSAASNAVLGTAQQRVVEGGGVVAVTAGGSACVVRGPPQLVGQALELLGAADRPAQRVEIEAALFEVHSGDNWRAGLRAQWHRQGDNGGVVARGSDVVPLGDLAGTVGGYGSVISGAAHAVLELVEQVSEVRVLSQPTVGVDVGREAVLSVGDQVPTVVQQISATTSGGASQQIQYRDVGVILRVVPESVDGGLIRLRIVQEVSDAQRTTSSDLDTPTISKRSVDTTVTVPIGHTALVGGLYRGGHNVAREGLPVLARIPFLGGLFGVDDERSESRELVLLATPRVVDEREEVARVRAAVERIGGRAL